jgi:hypothetical protein
VPDWQDTYPAVHLALAPEYRRLPESEVETVVHGVFGEDVSLADAEGFFDDLGHTLSRAASAVAPIVQRALPGVVSGAAGGAALGPFGMLGGALLGGLSSALSGGGAGGQSARPSAPGAAPPRPSAAAPAATSGSGGAVAQLLGALGSPTVQQALSAMLMGRAGAPTVSAAGGSQVPVAGITNLLGMLANRASAEWEEAVPSFEGEALGEGLEAGSPEDRSAWIFERLLPPASATGQAGEDYVPASGEGLQEGWIDELYDDLEAELMSEEPAEDAYDPPAGEAWSFNGHG